MKRYFISILIAIPFLLIGCSDNDKTNIIKFAVSADYPPFEYYENGKITGFDVELGQIIAKELGKEAIFENMQFSTILVALQSGSVDVAISTIAITEEREKNFDFSDSYYTETLVAIYLKDRPITDKSQLNNKKVACQLGTTMEIWLKKHIADAEISVMDNNNQAIEALKAGHVEVVIIDEPQGVMFSQKNPQLSYSVIAQSDSGYGIAVKKGSPLKEKINNILKILEKNGKLAELKKKWFKN